MAFLASLGPKRGAVVLTGIASLVALVVVAAPAWIAFPFSAWRLSTYVSIALFGALVLSVALFECLRNVSAKIAHLSDDRYLVAFAFTALVFLNVTFGGLFALIKLRVLFAF